MSDRNHPGVDIMRASIYEQSVSARTRADVRSCGNHVGRSQSKDDIRRLDSIRALRSFARATKMIGIAAIRRCCAETFNLCCRNL